MARPLRIECENAFQHVLSRGIEGRSIFLDERDHGHFLELLEVMTQRFDVELWAYVLMGNHYHLVLRTRRPNLSRAAQWLGVSYASWFNARHERRGHLFQGRFKSFLVEDERYLRTLLLYVHRNPLRAGLAERLADYRWSSYPCLAYGRGCASWLQRGSVLSLFGGEPAQFRRAVQDYSEEKEKLLENLWHGLFLGSRAGLVRLFGGDPRPDRHREKPQARAALRTTRTASVEALARELAAALGISAGDLEELRRPTRRVRRPLRDVLIYLLWRQGDFRLSQIGEFFRVGYTTISNARRRGQDHAERNREVRARLRTAGIPNK